MVGSLPQAVSEYIEASNAFDGERLIRAFAADALVNDARRELRGVEAIRRWSDEEIIGDRVTMEIWSVDEHYGDVIVNGLMDGDYDKTNLPDEVVLTHYFTVRDEKIVRLIIIRNRPVE
ncbi:MAG TPA: nuclear transport factor 2 family protein [Solirubrobacteraceae bacterium]|nr:nuclear transport factor 2 family protein [Solirubrobacteraceae bacterium]